MKIILLILSFIISFNVYPANNEPYTNIYRAEQYKKEVIKIKAASRIRYLKDRMFFLQLKMKYRTATRLDYALYDKYNRELQYLLRIFKSR